MGPARNEEPINILSLDGGGIRGVSELVTLHNIMLAIKDRDNLEYLPKPCDYFDLIVGTSTGGLIAIMLGRLKMTTAEALDEYDVFAKNIFSIANFRPDIKARYGDKALQVAVESIVSRRDSGEMMVDPQSSSERSKALVCAMPALNQGDPYLFRSYTVENDPFRSCKMWQAARATSAAPSYFKPMVIQSDVGTTEAFIDAAIGCNNPTAVALKEASEIFDKTRRIGCIVSLGTGTKSKNFEPSNWSLKFGARLGKLLKETTCDTETVHRKFKSDFSTDFQDTYFRFNVPGGAEGIGLAEWRKIDKLKSMTSKYLENAVRDRVLKVADVLRKNDSEGLTLGHACNFDKTQLVTVDRIACPRGVSTRLFTGRRDVLDKLAEVFYPRAASSQLRREFLLYGMGGVGKTQISLKFAEIQEENFSHVFWADATDSITLDQSYEAIAVQVLGEKSHLGGAITRQRVVRWLTTSKEEWLLVLDNCDDPTILNDYLPSADRGNVLYTSRDNSLRQRIPPGCDLEITELGEDDAITLFLKAAREPTVGVEQRKLSKPIVAELGCLPLAIDQAGSYCYMTKTPLQRYVDLFRQQKTEFLREVHFEGSDARNSAVYATFDVSYKALQRLARGQKQSMLGRNASSALRILSVICFYHYQNISKNIFELAAENTFCSRERLPFGKGELNVEPLLELDDAGFWVPTRWKGGIELLERFSLIKRESAGTISMHVLAHSWARDRMDKTDQAQQSLVARCLLFESISRVNGPLCIYHRRTVLPHLMACLDIETRHPLAVQESEWDCKAALPLREAGQWDLAEQLLKGAIDRMKYERELDSYPECSLQYLEALAELYFEQARYEEAWSIFRDVLKTRRHHVGDLNERTLNTKTRLGALYAQMSKRSKAEKVYSQILDAREHLHSQDPHHPRLLEARHQLAVIRAERAHENLPISAYEEIYELACRIYGKTHTKSLSYKKDLALALMKDKRFDDAELELVEVKNAHELAYGYENTETAGTYVALGQVYTQQGLMLWAEGMFEKALAIYEAIYGTKHPKTMNTNLLSVEALIPMGQYREAERRMEICFEMAKSFYGPENMHTRLYGRLKDLIATHVDSVTPVLQQFMWRWVVLITRRKWGTETHDVREAIEMIRERYGYEEVAEDDYFGRLPGDDDAVAMMTKQEFNTRAYTDANRVEW